MPDDPRVECLRELIDQATALQQEATDLVIEITDQLQRSIWLHDDRGLAVVRPKPDRRRRRRD
jgi:hypothetical protein